MMPSTIMKWCPSPFIIGHPGIAIFGHFPMSIRIIGPEFFLIYIWAPYLSVLRVIPVLVIKMTGILVVQPNIPGI
jgi:hypothetical protein